ncbi:MAG: GMC oxidoreductase [Albidovulum sp.]
MRDIVIGSGPAGVSAAMALLARGRQVTMLDGGKVLEPGALANQEALAAQDPRAWDDATRSAWMQPQYETPAGQVRRYGSDFAMEPASATLSETPDWFALRASQAVGGLSNLWGSAVLPYRQQDISDWPISADDLAPHYRAVAEFLPIAGGADDLDKLLPAFQLKDRNRIEPSVQAEALLARLSSKREVLARIGTFAGGARQAVDTSCRRCGMCLHGCPFGLIWSARDTLKDLRKNPNFTHRPGAVVAHLDESADGVTLHLKDGTSIKGGRVFLGAGVLETARILLMSGNGRRELMLKDSQHAFLPMIQRWRNKRRPDRGPFHTLPQIFVEMEVPELSARLVHAQVYTWNEHFPRDLHENYGRRLPIAKPFLTALARRLIVGQVFLHSDHSHQIGLGLSPDGRLVGRLAANGDMERSLKIATKHLSQAMAKVGLIPLAFASRPGAPGSSFHTGSTVPMAKETSPGMSDLLGRPYGLKRVHVIDASVLPTIPATTITFSVMANAHRIGSLAP